MNNNVVSIGQKTRRSSLKEMRSDLCSFDSYDHLDGTFEVFKYVCQKAHDATYPLSLAMDFLAWEFSLQYDEDEYISECSFQIDYPMTGFTVLSCDVYTGESFDLPSIHFHRESYIADILKLTEIEDISYLYVIVWLLEGLDLLDFSLVAMSCVEEGYRLQFYRETTLIDVCIPNPRDLSYG